MRPHRELAHVWDTANPPGATLALAGSLTIDNVGEVYESMDARLAQVSPAGLCTVDCTGVFECDSAGLALLLEIRRRTNESAGAFGLSASPALLRLLELTGTDEYLNVARPAAAQADRHSRGHTRPA